MFRIGDRVRAVKGHTREGQEGEVVGFKVHPCCECCGEKLLCSDRSRDFLMVVVKWGHFYDTHYPFSLEPPEPGIIELVARLAKPA